MAPRLPKQISMTEESLKELKALTEFNGGIADSVQIRLLIKAEYRRLGLDCVPAPNGTAQEAGDG